MSEPTKGVLLVVDDEPLKRVTLQIDLSEAGYAVTEVPGADAAMQYLRGHPVDVVITDLRMPGMDGLQFLEQVKALAPKAQAILMTAFGSVDTAIEAMKRGAYDYLTKPFESKVLLEKLDRLRNSPLWSGPPAEAPLPERLGTMIGRSYAARQLFEQIRGVADNETPILLQGESGSGAEQVAEALHQLSRRAQQPFVSLNCAAFSPHMLEVELFGTSPALAAPGTTAQPGRLDAARGGTVFLDEIDALPLELQIKIQQVLARRAGETSSAPSPDVRFVCATQRDLRGLVDSAHFRQDLYYRLAAVMLCLPPLRDRQEDVPLLAAEFLRNRAARGSRGKQVPTRISPHALEALVAYQWPGNILELEHTIERAIALASGDTIELKDILLPKMAHRTHVCESPETITGLPETIASVERKLIDAALRRATGNQARAAQYLGIPRTTLRDKMAKYGMVGNGSTTTDPGAVSSG